MPELAVSLGTDAYLTKPASARSLLVALGAVLGSRANVKP